MDAILPDTELKNQIIYKEILEILELPESQILNKKALVDYFEKNDILSNVELIQYIRSIDVIFNNTYTNHFPYRNYGYTYSLMSLNESFCLCWLMALYH